MNDAPTLADAPSLDAKAVAELAEQLGIMAGRRLVVSGN